MPKNKNRLLLVVIFAVAAGFIISSKINNVAKTSSNIQTETNNTSSPEVKKSPTTKQINNAQTDEDKLPDSPQSPSNYLEKIPECLDIQVSNTDSLKNISDKNNWMDKDPKNLIRQNLIYKKLNQEIRISVTPSQSSKTWMLQSFDVDKEGLPIVKNKILGLQYYQLAEKIKFESNGFNLDSDEQHIQVDSPNTSGSILYINDQPIEIKLFNKSNQRLLECQGTYCLCNQALSS